MLGSLLSGLSLFNGCAHIGNRIDAPLHAPDTLGELGPPAIHHAGFDLFFFTDIDGALGRRLHDRPVVRNLGPVGEKSAGDKLGRRAQFLVKPQPVVDVDPELLHEKAEALGNDEKR